MRSLSSIAIRLLLPALILCSLAFWSRPAHGEVGDVVNFEVAARWGHGPTYASDAATDLLLMGEGSCLRVFDNQSPTNPAFRSEVLVGGVVMDIARSGNFAFVAAANGGLRIVDLSDVWAPVEVGSLDLPGTPYAVDAIGTTVYVASAEAGLRIVDVSDPTAPAELGFDDTDFYAVDVQVLGNLAYVADMDAGALEIYDVSDPSNIQMLGSKGTPGPPWGVDIAGSRAILVDDYAGIVVFDVSDPTDITQLAQAWLDDVGYDVISEGDLAFIANDWEGFAVVDLSSLPSLTQIGQLDTSGYAFGIESHGDTIYLADTQEGLRVLDISDPTSPVELQTLGGVGPTRKVLHSGTVSYALDEYHGMRILQPTYGGGAVQLGFVELPGSPWSVDVDDGIAYVAVQQSGDVRIVDVQDLRNPFEVASIDLPEYPAGSGAFAVSAGNGRLAVVDKYYGFYLFDVSDPTAPVANGKFATLANPKDMVMRGDHVFIADQDGAIRVLDVSAAPAISQLSYLPYVGSNFALELDGDLLFVAKGWRGVWVLDVSDPTNPSSITLMNTPGSAEDLSAAYPYLYVADGPYVRCYDYSDVQNLTEVGSYRCDDFSSGLSAFGRSVHVGGMAGGWTMLNNTLQSVDVPPTAERIELEQNRPNPFNPRTTLRFALAKQGPVRLEIIDLAGRRVRVLVDEWLSVGPHVREWDGRDDSGVRVASGSYRYRLAADGQVRVRGMVLLR